MTIATLVDRVKIVVSSSGTGPFTFVSAVPGYRGVEALTNGATYNYATGNGANYEVGTGVYIASTNTLVRSPQISSNGGAAVSFPANIELAFTVLAADILPPGSLPISQTTGAATDVAMSQKATTDALTALSALVATKVSESELAGLATEPFVTAAITAILTGASAWTLPDEANGDVIPVAGSKLPYLSAGVLKIA